MIVDFLSTPEGVPLTKTFTLKSADNYDIQPYPNSWRFNSHRFDVSSIDDLHTLLLSQAEQGRCLLKGPLTKTLEDAPRAGCTNSMESTHFLVLDLDFDSGWDSIDDFLASLSPSFEDVSYIFQHSSSAGITSSAGLRGHIILLLAEPVLPSILKVWLRHANLYVPELRQQLTLSANGVSVRWPLDVTTCQNDKLIYIAPPTCNGFDDPIPADQRITLVKKQHDVVSTMATFRGLQLNSVEKETRKVVNALRQEIGLPRRNPRTKKVGSIEYLANPDEAVVTGINQARGFTYLNLNGGDSFAYYFPDDNPEFLYNFKGEPVVRLQDIAPVFYAEYTAPPEVEEITPPPAAPAPEPPPESTEATPEPPPEPAARPAPAPAPTVIEPEQSAEPPEPKDFIPLVFRDRRSDTYYNVIIHADGSVEYSPASSTQKLRHFMRQYGEPAPDIIEDWTVEFDPRRLDIIDVPQKWLNTFTPTKYVTDAKRVDGTEIPPVIARIIKSVCGDCEETIDHFLNWLAFIFQTRKKTGTAWVLYGVPGTGKGLLISYILKPLLGDSHVLEFTAKQVEDKFNAALERACVMAIDEFHYESSRGGNLVMNTLKNLITEPRIALRAMRRDAIMVPSYLNVIIFSNHADPVRLDSNDRRFNVAPEQRKMLVMKQEEVDAIEGELDQFAQFLATYEVDEERVRRILTNEAREKMIAASQSSVEKLFESLRNGDLYYFLEYATMRMSMVDPILRNEFMLICNQWANDALQGRSTVASVHDINTVYRMIIGGRGIGPAKIKRMLAIHRISFEAGVQGVPVLWAIEPEQLERYFEHHPNENDNETRPEVPNVPSLAVAG